MISFYKLAFLLYMVKPTSSYWAVYLLLLFFWLGQILPILNINQLLKHLEGITLPNNSYYMYVWTTECF